MRRFAWYGRLSTKDKQDPTLSFPSQRKTCERKVEEVGGRIVADFTDQESGRRDDRAAWSELVREARDPEKRRFRRRCHLLDLATRARSVPRPRLRAGAR